MVKKVIGEKRDRIPGGYRTGDAVDYAKSEMSFNMLYRDRYLTITELAGDKQDRATFQVRGVSKSVQFCTSGKIIRQSRGVRSFNLNDGEYRDTFGQSKEYAEWRALEDGTTLTCVTLRDRENFAYTVTDFLAGALVSVQGPGPGERPRLMVLIEGEIDWGDDVIQGALDSVVAIDPGDDASGIVTSAAKLLVIQ